MSWVIYNRELNGFLTNAPDNCTYFSSTGDETRKFKRKKDAKQFLADNPSHSLPDSPWYNGEARVIINEKFLEDVPIEQSFSADINKNMTIYIVIGTNVQYFENDLCWDDGYYDDYYETEVESKEFIGAYLTKEQAEKKVDEVENTNAYDYVSYFPYELGEEEVNNEQQEDEN